MSFWKKIFVCNKTSRSRITPENQNTISKKKSDNSFVIQSNFKTNEINYLDFISTLQQKHEYKYFCPICLRNFKDILISSCCHNYICLLCANQINQSSMKCKSCPFCYNKNSTCSNIDKKATIKRYIDTPMSLITENEENKITPEKDFTDEKLPHSLNIIQKNIFLKSGDFKQKIVSEKIIQTLDKNEFSQFSLDIQKKLKNALFERNLNSANTKYSKNETSIFLSKDDYFTY